MNFKQYYQSNKTYIVHTDDRLSKIIQIVQDLQPMHILDVGCGNGYLIQNLIKKGIKSDFNGIDVYDNKTSGLFKYKKADITNGLPYSDQQFDCVILGEVIEHIPNTDFLLREIYRVMKNDGNLIISTPNLVCWLNRIIVPLGIQPLFTETSSEIKFGRVWEKLGQGRKSEGHLKIFTHLSLRVFW